MKTSPTFFEQAVKLISQPWNSSSQEYIPAKILIFLFNDNSFSGLLKFLKDTKKNWSSSVGSFESYYGSNVIELTQFFVDNANNEFGIDVVIKAIKSLDVYRKFNWENFLFLEKENLLNIIQDFYSDFRGTITNVHRVYNNKYIIIEAKRKDEETRFYIVTEDLKRVKTECYSSFEEALFNSLVGQHLSSGMIAIYEYSKKG